MFLVFVSEISSLQSSNRCARLRQSHRTLRDGSFGVALSQALRARLRSHRPSGTFRNRLTLASCLRNSRYIVAIKMGGRLGKVVGVSASGKTAFRHGYNHQEVSMNLMTLC